MKKYINIICGVLLLGLASCGEDTVGNDLVGTLSGTVKAKADGEPIGNVEISTSPASSTVFTDSLGNFKIENIIADEYSVKAESEGFVTAFEGVTITADAESRVAFDLTVSTANNRAPSTPVAVFPEDNGSVSVLEVDFAWDSDDPDSNDLYYELEIRNDIDDDVLTFDNITDTTYTVNDLKYGRKYFWQVKVSDSIADTVLSPVFTFRTNEFPDESYYFVREVNDNNVIYVSDGGELEATLTNTNLNSFRPRKNNNINRVAFLRTVGSQTHLFTMRPDGSDVNQVTSSIPVRSINDERVGYSWSNFGAYLIYPHLDKLYKVRASGEGKEVIFDAPEGRFIMNVEVSYDSSVILVHTTDVNGYEAAIFTIDNSGNRDKTIIDDVDGSLGGLDITVDNRLVLYTRDVSGYESAGDRDLNMKMFFYDLEDSTIYDVSGNKPNGTNDKDPRFSPNEAEVIFVNTSNSGNVQNDIYKISFDETFDIGDRVLQIENAKMPDWE